MTLHTHKIVNGLVVELTEAEIQELNARDAISQAAQATTEYRSKRAGEYPSLIDYIDGIVKGDQTQVQAYIDACLAVKAKYPKPE